MAADFGDLSAVDEVLLKQACLLLARSERVHSLRDIDVGLRMSSDRRLDLLEYMDVAAAIGFDPCKLIRMLRK